MTEPVDDSDSKTLKPRRRSTLPKSIRDAVMAQFERDGRICGICGEEIGLTEELHIDHMLPVSRDGRSDLSNLHVVHKACNLSKGKRTLEEHDERIEHLELLFDSDTEVWFPDGRPEQDTASFPHPFAREHVLTFVRGTPKRMQWTVSCSCGWRVETPVSLEIDALVASELHIKEVLQRRSEDAPPLTFRDHEAMTGSVGAPGMYNLPDKRYVGRCVCGWSHTGHDKQDFMAAWYKHVYDLLMALPDAERNVEIHRIWAYASDEEIDALVEAVPSDEERYALLQVASTLMLNPVTNCYEGYTADGEYWVSVPRSYMDMWLDRARVDPLDGDVEKSVNTMLTAEFWLGNGDWDGNVVVKTRASGLEDE